LLLVLLLILHYEVNTSMQALYREKQTNFNGKYGTVKDLLCLQQPKHCVRYVLPR